MKGHIALVTMPWAQPTEPALSMGTLHSVLQNSNFEVASFSYYLDFAEFILKYSSYSYPLTALNCYQSFIGNYGLGEWIFSVEPFRSPNESYDELYIEYLRSNRVPERTIKAAQEIRKLVPNFLEKCVDDLYNSIFALLGHAARRRNNSSVVTPDENC